CSQQTRLAPKWLAPTPPLPKSHNLCDEVLVGIPVLASLSYVPQVREAWPSGSTEDLSLFMLWALTLGLGFWIVYGVIRLDDRRRERD
ncbi:hypothetical protein ABIC08_008068, partial [Bradyrhizobium sp. RT9b]|uniref:SemiSWEET family sugar transporter n=1 Tax=unclassified Bradyrhizobium TaxID=2631580 RepID=UPI003393DDF5